MGGFFLDNLILWIVRLIRSEIKVRKARNWPNVEGRMLRDQIIDDGLGKWRPSIHYEFALNEQTYYGEVAGYQQGKQYAEELADKVVAGGRLVIRYNPINPDKNCVLNSDNAELLPFVVNEREL